MSVKLEIATPALLIALAAMVVVAIFVILPVTIYLFEAQVDTIDDRLTKYPLGKYVSTSDEYNRVFNESFSGHIIAQSDRLATQEVTIRDHGEERTLNVKWLNLSVDGGRP
jgi:hypothetical protein